MINALSVDVNGSKIPFASFDDLAYRAKLFPARPTILELALVCQSFRLNAADCVLARYNHDGNVLDVKVAYLDIDLLANFLEMSFGYGASVVSSDSTTIAYFSGFGDYFAILFQGQADPSIEWLNQDLMRVLFDEEMCDSRDKIRVDEIFEAFKPLLS